MFSGPVLISAIIYIVILGIVFWLLWWLVNYINPPEPFKKVANVVLAVAAVLVLIGVLMGIAGHPIIRW